MDSGNRCGIKFDKERCTITTHLLSFEKQPYSQLNMRSANGFFISRFEIIVFLELLKVCPELNSVSHRFPMSHATRRSILLLQQCEAHYGHKNVLPI